MCTVDKCERLALSVAANAFRIGNSIDCKLALYAVSQPVLFGDNRAIHLGPHNAAYEELMGHVKRAKIVTSAANLQNWASPLLLKSAKDSYNLQEPRDFARLELPEKFKEDTQLLAPANYIEMLNARNSAFAEMQAAIKGAKLTPEQQTQLHNAIQGYFREWVVSSNQLRPITDLVKMIDNEEFKEGTGE